MTPKQEKEFNKKQFLISTKRADVRKLLAEIEQLETEMFMKLMNGDKE